MNTFKFIGTILNENTDKMVKTFNNGNKCLKFLVKENENNSAYVQMYSYKLVGSSIQVFSRDNKKISVKYEDRNKQDVLKNISNISKYTIDNGYIQKQFIWEEDFINYFIDMIQDISKDTIFEISGEYVLSEYNNKMYNNFNIKSIKINKNARPELTLELDLFYNHESLDESDKKNKFILNSYIEQYSYASKKKMYYPLKVQFITNKYNFKNLADVEIIRHRKSNMQPKVENGFVKAKWEAQYIRGAKEVIPPLETLPKDIQFEIINAGRDIKEYMGRIVDKAEECICLTRPNNTLNKDGAVYVSLDCTDNEFKSKIINLKNDDYKSLDSLAQEDAIKNPFNPFN